MKYIFLLVTSIIIFSFFINFPGVSNKVNAKADDGLYLNETGAYEGYTLFATLSSEVTYLIDNRGNIIHTWESDCRPGNSVYLLEDGNLLRTGSPKGKDKNQVFQAGPAGGKVQIIDLEGNITWEFTHSSDTYLLHHDIEPLPNGDILMISWENKTAEEAIDEGRNPYLLENSLWPDYIIEVQPEGERRGKIVWKWHAWDHIIQDYDRSKNNYGNVSEHAELIDINYGLTNGPRKKNPDWLHINSIDYNEELNQIILSVHNFNEIWIIDKNTTAEEAKGHTGGRMGKGGDILYRWGNPLAYRKGTIYDQKLFGQHDAQWIEKGLAGEGNILIFNNGLKRPEGEYSSVEEIKPPVDNEGNYILKEGTFYGPAKPEWSYSDPLYFLSARISGAQRLPNGNTLICSGESGIFFEITQEKEIVWKYVNPFSVQNRPNCVFRVHRYEPDYSGLEEILNLR